VIETVAITDVCGFQGGTQPPKSEWSATKEPDYIRMLQIRDFTQGKASYIEFIKNKKTLKTCDKDDVLIGRYGASIGKILTGLAGAYNVAIVKTIPDTKRLDRKFLLHLLKGYQFQHFIQNIGSRAAQAGFNKEDLTNFRFGLPPLAEQKKIAAILDAADRLRQKDAQLIAKYNTLSQSLFLDMFGDPVTNPMGWSESKLSNVCSKITDGTHHSPPLKESGIPYVTAKHVKESGLNFLAKASYVNQENHDEIYKRCSPVKGDVLYIKDGATTGVACINTFDEEISLLSSVALLQVKTAKLNNRFLCYWLNHKGIKEKLIQQYMSGAAIQRYTLKKINSFTLMLPPITLQNQFAERIQAIEVQKQQAQASLQKSEDLFNSLLQRAFKGELTT